MAVNLKWPEEGKEIGAWVLGSLGVLMLCLLATFPYDALHARVMAEVNRATGMEVRVADWAVGMPLGLDWRQVTLTAPQGDPIHVAFLQARLGILKALSGGVGLDVVVHVDEASPAGGVAKGTLIAQSWSLAGPVAVKGQLQQVDLSKILRRYVTHGVLNGDFSHRMESGQPAIAALKGDGSWKADVKDLTLDQIPLGNGRTLSLAFTRVTAGVTCRDMVCDVNELKGEGPDGSFTGEGKITLQQPVHNSQLALTVTVVPGAGFASKATTLGLPPLPPGTPMTVKIVGTVAQARIAL